MTDPVVMVVDHDTLELAAFERALRRRYGNGSSKSRRSWSPRSDCRA
jgi:hypothetical protein